MENQTTPMFQITGAQLKLKIEARMRSIDGARATVETQPATAATKFRYEQLQRERALLRSFVEHVADGPHLLTAHQLARVFESLAPIDPQQFADLLAAEGSAQYDVRRVANEMAAGVRLADGPSFYGW